jgi:hypothetical protein
MKNSLFISLAILALAAGCASTMPAPSPHVVKTISAEAGKTAGSFRDEMLGKCRPAIRRFYRETENQLLIPIRFLPLADNAPVAAASRYDSDKDEAVLLVRLDAEDVDIAHELMHFRLDLVDRFTVLAWRRNVTPDPAIEKAYGRIRTYIDDDIVHRQLVKLGMKPDGEVIRPALFNQLYAPAAANLEKGAPREHDGLGHLDACGRGTLCRAAFLIQAEQILAQYGKSLTPDHRAKTERFIRAFRAHRPEESAVADKVLALFARHDVNTDVGHQAISDGWIEIEGLTPYIGSTRFAPRYDLPFPPDLKK